MIPTYQLMSEKEKMDRKLKAEKENKVQVESDGKERRKEIKLKIAEKKGELAGLLSMAMKCNSQRMKLHKPLFKMIGPEVEDRPLAVYDCLSGGV